MSEIITIRKGLDIKPKGEAAHELVTVTPKTVAVKPTDFIGVFPKLLVGEGDTIKAGSPLFYDKYREQILFTAPVCGTIKAIKRGAKRVLQEIVIEPAEQQDFIDFGKADPNNLDCEEVVEKLLASGLWPMIRQRPYSTIAAPDDNPKAIVIPAFDTAPLAPDYNYIVAHDGEAFQTGIDALRKLTSGDIYLNIEANTETSSVFTNTKGVTLTRFKGPHPTGNVSTQISHLNPINKGDIIWYLRPQEVLSIGRLFLNGRYDATRIIALTGPMVEHPKYYKSLIGSAIHPMTVHNIEEGHARYISGNVLTGTKIESDGYVSFYDSQVTVIPEGDYSEFFGWAMPGLNKFSFYRQFFSFLTPNRKYALDTNLHGGERAYVLTGQYEKVFPFNIYPMQLIKAILIEDIDQMENLGIYEIDAEDFALVEFIDASKTEIQTIVRNGLELMRKEMS
jgi:Na+-transporting NADH:ubiquinone oxidoreductase subunit A